MPAVQPRVQSHFPTGACETVPDPVRPCQKLYTVIIGELTYAWIFNEYPTFVHQDNRRFVSQETGNLYIAKVEASDVGNYTCVVTNTVTNSRVLGPPTPLILRNDGVMGEYEPKIEVQFPETVPSAKGTTVKLECFALGKSHATLKTHLVSRVNTGNASKINCGTAQFLRLAGGERMGNRYPEKPGDTAQPNWIQKISDAHVAMEESVAWECRASGRPKPSYRWLKDGEPLLPQGRVQLEQGSLTITNVSLSDAGMYQCVAENRHGIIFASAELSVIGKCTFPECCKPPKTSKAFTQAGLAKFQHLKQKRISEALRISDNLLVLSRA
ncbi:hypothetical protein llap_15752 [Limosa lapponica baueri]|uniref:Ig-like domain-containing protein n=2 Tax=Charadriiformes TaxID=8906 RepID=A0A2I0TJF5_LIMLA|nr:hypothetical protein llap_15752 [Limosa lapponica baueri]